jgi:hypothetical protein
MCSSALLTQKELRVVDRQPGAGARGRLAALLPGALAGAVGTVAMDAVLYASYRRGGGKLGPLQWEFSTNVDGWSSVSSPGLVGKLLLHDLLRREPPDRWARPAQNIVHWSTGVGWGSMFAVITVQSKRSPWTWGIGLGSAAWLTSYIVLPIVKVYKPIWEYDAKTLMGDLGAHLLYGVTSSTALVGLGRGAYCRARSGS